MEIQCPECLYRNAIDIPSKNCPGCEMKWPFDYLITTYRILKPDRFRKLIRYEVE